MSTTRYRALPGHWRTAVSIVAFGAVALCAARTFNVDIVSAEYLAGTHFFYLIAALLLPLVFILFPSSKAAVAVTLVDLTLATATGAVLLFCVLRANDIYEEGWEFAAPAYGIAVAVLAWILLLEIGRRCGGWPVFWVAFCLSLYPLVAAALPTVVDGLSYDFFTTVAFHLYSAESFQGVPLRAFVDWAVGYLVLGAVLQVTGGGDFFLNLTFALLGKTRGGPAKVSILASGLMGSMSGSVVSNVLTTGALTVPAMRRAGFSRTYAAGIEACASTGGVLMPPIMGAAAFVMARYLGVPYADVAIAALIPSVLYFYGLYIQVDAYAARYELTAGVSDSVPGVTDTLLKGWDYVCTFALLIWLLLGLHWHQEAPYLAAVLLLLLRARFGFAKLSRHAVERFGLEIGTQLAELLGILAPVGVIIGALLMTGMVGNLTYDIVAMAGEKLWLLLVLGALTSFILGVGMTVVAAYTFLAITLAPILIRVGIEPIAAHMFILYWGMLSYITPPVAIGAFAAAGLAGAPPMRTAFEAMRLGTIIYIIPFFFVLSPTLLLQGAALTIIVDVGAALAGIALVASALQGYLIGVGSLVHTYFHHMLRPVLFVLGFCIAIPLSATTPTLKALAVIAASTLITGLYIRRRTH